MGASYVEGTGVGPGSAEGKNRGPGNGRSQFFSLLDPHVVAHGTATIGEGYEVFVPLPSNIRVPSTHLAVFVSGKGSSIKIIEDGVMVGFVVGGIPGSNVDYIVMDANNACFSENNNPE